MTEKAKEVAKSSGMAAGTGGVVAAVVVILLQLGVIGPERDELERRISTLEERSRTAESTSAAQVSALQQLIDLRFNNLERSVEELKADLRRTRGQ